MRKPNMCFMVCAMLISDIFAEEINTRIYTINPNAQHYKCQRLTSDKHSFLHKNNNVTINTYLAMRTFKETSSKIEKMFADPQYPPLQLSYLSEWAGIYAAQHESAVRCAAKRYSYAYALSLMYLGRFKHAEEICQAWLNENPNDYGCLLQLGLLSLYRKGNFHYLEKSFEKYPERTLLLLQWHIDKINYQPIEDWDFIDAFFSMLYDKQRLWSPARLPMGTLIFIREIFMEKYGNYLSNEQRTSIPPKMLKVADRFVFPKFEGAK